MREMGVRVELSLYWVGFLHLVLGRVVFLLRETSSS